MTKYTTYEERGRSISYFLLRKLFSNRLNESSVMDLATGSFAELNLKCDQQPQQRGAHVNFWIIKVQYRLLSVLQVCALLYFTIIDRSTHTLMPTRTTVPKGVKAWINSSSVGRSSGSRVDHVTFNALCFTSFALLVPRPSILRAVSKLSTVGPERKVCARRSWACQKGAYISSMIQDDTKSYSKSGISMTPAWRLSLLAFIFVFCSCDKDQNVLILTVLLS